jgi:hypothetical protein
MFNFPEKKKGGGSTLWTYYSNHYKILTCSRQVKAASRYFFTFLEHAEDTKLKMAFGLLGSPAEIALWQDAERVPNAYNRASFPCHI